MHSSEEDGSRMAQMNMNIDKKCDEGEVTRSESPDVRDGIALVT